MPQNLLFFLYHSELLNNYILIYKKKIDMNMNIITFIVNQFLCFEGLLVGSKLTGYYKQLPLEILNKQLVKKAPLHQRLNYFSLLNNNPVWHTSPYKWAASNNNVLDWAQ